MGDALANIQPIVLVGGMSRRFGRDKLLEPVVGVRGAGGEREGGNVRLVDRPLMALREVFGPRVAAVGRCDPAVAARFDLVIADRYPGTGPLGGIVSALEETRGPVFVLAGDLPRITGAAVRVIAEVAVRADTERTWAVLAYSTALEPCVGVYWPAVGAGLRARLESGDRLSLFDAVPAERRVEVKLDPLLLRNANTPDELAE